MDYYNIYYYGKKLNNRPIPEDQLEEIKDKEDIYKRNNLTNVLEKIPTNKLNFIKTIII